MKKLLLAIPFLLIACNSEKKIEEALKNNPDILLNVIKEHPKKFIDTLNEAVKVAQAGQAKEREEEERKKLEESYNNPLKPEIRDDELIRGNKNGQLVLVEYSDFECPFCARGYKTVLTLLEKYKGKIKFVYKHLPLSFHPQAMIASQYYEAIRLQNEDKAIKFHDAIYEDQRSLQKGEAFLKAEAKKLKVDMNKLAKDIKSDKVMNRIKQDQAEAAKFGFQGTPGFLLNGVPVKGAYPVSHFEGIVQELKKRGKVNL